MLRYIEPITGRSSAWLERVVWDHEVAGSNPVTPIFPGAGMGRIRQDIKVKGKKCWTLFDSGARNTYVVPAVAALVGTFKLPKSFKSRPMSLSIRFVLGRPTVPLT